MDTLRGDLPTPERKAIEDKREIELRTLPVADIEPLWGGNNTAELVYLKGDGNGVFKPGMGEEPLPEFQESHFKLFKREKASYLVSVPLHPGLVPVTTIRDVDHREGSIQDFVPDPKLMIHQLRSLYHLEESLFGLAIFDYATWDKDRKPANFFILGKEIRAIDNGLSFDQWPQARITDNLYRYVVGQPVPHELQENYSKFVHNEREQTELREKLSVLVPNRTIDAMFARVIMVNSLFAKGGVTMRDLDRMVYRPY